MNKIKLAMCAAGLSLVSASAFATNCSDFVAGPNKVAAKYMSTVGTGVYHNLYFNRKGNFTLSEDEARQVNVDFVIKSYQLPADVAKKVFIRFTKAETLGTRTANRRLVCKFFFEYSDGFQTGSGSYMIDVEPTSDYNDITAYYGPGEPRLSGSFNVRAMAQQNINGAISQAIKTNPEYMAQVAKFN